MLVSKVKINFSIKIKLINSIRFNFQAPQTKEELIRELQLQRAAEEAAAQAKKKLEEQRLLVKQKNPKLKQKKNYLSNFRPRKTKRKKQEQRK